MLEEFTITCGSGKAFQKYSKKFNVNMTVIMRTLHEKDKCYYSKGMTNFIPFDSIEEVEQFEKEHNVIFRRCGNCFSQGNK